MQNRKKPDKKGYYELITSDNQNFTIRKRMVIEAMTDGIKPTARAFGTTPKTVRKWLGRFKEHGNDGLYDQSRRPLRSPNKTPKHIEEMVLEKRRQIRGFGSARLVREFELPLSHNAAHRILKEHNLIREHRRKKHHKKNDLRHIKAAYPAFTRFQMDVKYLTDLPHFWPYLQAHNLPKFQYTIREVSTGVQFLTYSDELSKTYATLTVQRFLNHLKQSNIDLSNVCIQTDLGVEFDGDTIHYRKDGFHGSIESTGAKHLFNPPARPNANGDVESIHNTIENEFYEVQDFKSLEDFLLKAATYQSWYNIARLNSSRKWKSPADILSEKDPNIKLNILLLNPLIYGSSPIAQRGYHVPGLVDKFHFCS